MDLVRFMREQHAAGALALGPSHTVLELGCGHGLPGIHAAQQGAAGGGGVRVVVGLGRVCVCLLVGSYARQPSINHQIDRLAPMPISPSPAMLFTLLKQTGARVCFMDLNAEVLAHVTRPNLALNCPPAASSGAYHNRPPPLLVSGDWADASRVLRRHWWAYVGCVSVHGSSR